LPRCCDNFLYSFKGTAFGRAGPFRPLPIPCWDRGGLREFVGRREVHRQELPVSGGVLCDFGAAACPRPMGGSPPVAGAAAGLLPRHRRQAVPAATNRSAAPARMAGPSSGRRAVSHRERSPSRTRLAARRFRDGASATLDSDLARQDLGTYREDGGGMTARGGLADGHAGVAGQPGMDFSHAVGGKGSGARRAGAARRRHPGYARRATARGRRGRTCRGGRARPGPVRGWRTR
jgi:hypothetical protein